MQKIGITVVFLMGAAHGQAMTPTQVAAAISIQNTALQTLTFESTWSEKTSCTAIKKLLSDSEPIQKLLRDFFSKPGADFNTTITNLSLANFSNQSGLNNIKKAHKIFCIDVKGPYTAVLTDLYRQLADKDFNLAGLYLAASGL